MAEEKRYFWIKIKDSFMTSDKVDFLMSQKDGANYIVLYQMLCLMTLNTNGELSRKIGEVIIPFDVDKIARDCKYFKRDTIIVALELFKKLGMIYQESNGTLVISEFDNMVGSSKQDDHTKRLTAERQARFRLKNKQNVTESVTVTEEVTQEITNDVTLNRNTEIRDKIIDNSISINTNTIYEKTEHEPRNDYEKIEKTYFDLWDSLYKQRLVNTEKPIIDYGKIRKLEKSLLEDKTNPVSVEMIQKAIINSEKDNFIRTSGYSLSTILSKSMFNKLLNGSIPVTNSYTKNARYIKPDLDDQSGWLKES